MPNAGQAPQGVQPIRLAGLQGRRAGADVLLLHQDLTSNTGTAHAFHGISRGECPLLADLQGFEPLEKPQSHISALPSEPFGLLVSCFAFEAAELEPFEVKHPVVRA